MTNFRMFCWNLVLLCHEINSAMSDIPVEGIAINISPTMYRSLDAEWHNCFRWIRPWKVLTARRGSVALWRPSVRLRLQFRRVKTVSQSRRYRSLRRRRQKLREATWIVRRTYIDAICCPVCLGDERRRRHDVTPSRILLWNTVHGNREWSVQLQFNQRNRTNLFFLLTRRFPPGYGCNYC